VSAASPGAGCAVLGLLGDGGSDTRDPLQSGGSGKFFSFPPSEEQSPR